MSDGLKSSAVAVGNDVTATIQNNVRDDTIASNPIGALGMWLTDSAPTGWLICDGSAVSRATYSSLYAVIADVFGAGDGSTTFNLPDLRNRVPVGRDTTVKVVIDNCDGAWTAGSNVVASNDTGDKKEGTGSVKLAVASGATAGQILGYKTISVATLAGQTRVGMWIKSSVALSAGDLQYKMDDTASIASALETINIPALTANVWTKIYLTLANPASDLLLISHGIYQVNDKGAFDLWIDDINYGENYETGATGGAKTKTLATTEMPAHSHSIDGYSAGGGSGTQMITPMNSSAGSPISFQYASAVTTGDGRAHNLMQPYITINYIIRYGS